MLILLPLGWTLKRDFSGQKTPTTSGLPRHPEWVLGRSHVVPALVEHLAGPGLWDRCPHLRLAEATSSAAGLHPAWVLVPLGRAFPAVDSGVWWPRVNDGCLCGVPCT